MKSKTKKNSIWQMLLILIGLCGFVAYAAIHSHNKNKEQSYKPSSSAKSNYSKPVVKKPSYQPAVISMSANDLYEAYNANAIGADLKYKDKTVLIYGTLRRAGKDILDQPYLVIGGTGILDGVQCMFSKKQETALARLVKNEFVRIEGKVKGKVIGNVLMRECVLK